MFDAEFVSIPLIVLAIVFILVIAPSAIKANSSAYSVRSWPSCSLALSLCWGVYRGADERKSKDNKL